jgi:hypothetical protein
MGARHFAADSVGLFSQAVLALQRKLQSEPDDVVALGRLGNYQRMLGNLSNALDCYRSIAALEPDSTTARFMVELLAGRDLPPTTGALFPASPFVLVADWLSADEVSSVWDILADGRFRFTDSSIEKDGVNPNKRSSVSIDHDDLGVELAWFLQKLQGLLSSCWNRLGVEPFEIVNREIQVTNHRDGDFLTLHRDCSVSGPSRSRTVSFVYYFCRTPKKFTGGDLLMFDPVGPGVSGNSTFTRIQPQSNQLLIFPSYCYHQVTEVSCESSDFLDSRLSVHGCLHRRLD